MTSIAATPDVANGSSEAVAKYCTDFDAGSGVIKAMTRRYRPYSLTETDHERLLSKVVERRNYRLLVQLRKWGLDRIRLRDDAEREIVERAMFMQEMGASAVAPILKELRRSWGFTVAMRPSVRAWAVTIAMRGNEVELLKELRRNWNATKSDLRAADINAAAYAALHKSLDLFEELHSRWEMSAEDMCADDCLGLRVAVRLEAKSLVAILKAVSVASPPRATEVTPADVRLDPWMARRLGLARPSVSPPLHDADADPSLPP